MKASTKSAGLVALFLAVVALPSLAHASPRALPYTYPYMTPAAGSLELEPNIDIVPVRVARENPDGTLTGTWGTRYVFNTELEYAITDRLELAFYLAATQGATAATPFLRFEGIKERVRYRFGEPGKWPVDVAVYLELAQFANEFEFEEKLILAHQFGKLLVATNLWVEQEYYFQAKETKYIYNPTLGAAYEISPRLSIGLEYWARGRFDDPGDGGVATDGQATLGQRGVHYLGPTAMVQGKNVFWSVGVYSRLDELGSAAKVDDTFGKFWVRTIIGLDL